MAYIKAKQKNFKNNLDGKEPSTIWLRDLFLTLCNKHIFYFLLFDVLTLRPCWPWKSAPPRASTFLEIANKSQRSIPFICKLTNPEGIPQHLHFSDLHSGSLFCSNPPRAKMLNNQDSPHIQVPAENNETIQSKPVNPVSFSPSSEMTIKILAFTSSTPSET